MSSGASGRRAEPSSGCSTVWVINLSSPLSPLHCRRTILHDWSDDDCLRILSNVREAINGRKATLTLVEQVVAEPFDPVKMRGLLDLQMRVLTHKGRERTLAEWRDLLQRTGFKLKAAHSTRSLFSVIEAVPTA